MSETQIAPIPKPKNLVIQRTIVTDWTAVTEIPPVRCTRCGHLHFARLSSVDWELAPQWHLCDEDCGCRGLKLGSDD